MIYLLSVSSIHLLRHGIINLWMHYRHDSFQLTGWFYLPDIKWTCEIAPAWWRNQMETFSALLAICAGNSPAQRPVTRSFDVSVDLRLNKRLRKQSWGYRAHYDVIVMGNTTIRQWSSPSLVFAMGSRPLMPSHYLCQYNSINIQYKLHDFHSQSIQFNWYSTEITRFPFTTGNGGYEK